MGLGYAYDYDDLLNMSGIVNGVVVQDQYGNPSETSPTQPYFVVTLSDMTGTPVPDISTDAYNYAVTIGSAANGVTVTFTYYDVMGVKHTQVASSTVDISLGQVYVNKNQPFQATFTFTDPSYYSYNSTFNVNLLRQVVPPAGTSYTAADAQYQQGFVFKISGGTQANPEFTISYNSSPPQWPG